MSIDLWQPIVTTLLFTVAVIAIWQTRNIQKRELRHRLLNDIIEWATKVINWRSENRTVFREMARLEDITLSQRLMYSHLAEMQAFFSAITGLNKHITKLSLTFQHGLPEDIQKLIIDLKAFIDFNEAWRKKLFTHIDKETVSTDIEEDSKKADGLAQQMGESASIILEKVADIKGREIG